MYNCTVTLRQVKVDADVKKRTNLFFTSYWCKIASAAKNGINSSDDLCLLFCINPSSMLFGVINFKFILCDVFLCVRLSRKSQTQKQNWGFIRFISNVGESSSGNRFIFYTLQRKYLQLERKWSVTWFRDTTQSDKIVRDTKRISSCFSDFV